MAPVMLMETHEASHRGSGNTKEGINEDLMRQIDAATIANKIDFFRFIGLEISKVCDVHYNTNNNVISGNENKKIQEKSKRRCESSSGISNDDIPAVNVSCQSKSKRHRSDEKKNNLGDMVAESHGNVKLIRECRVTIIGEKCRVCGKSFKCIKDVQTHVKKKHRRKKPRARVVLKIGDEVISRVPIRRKHLKRAQREEDEEKEDDRKIVNANDTNDILWSGNVFSPSERNNDKRVTPLIELKDICDMDDTGSNLIRITAGDVFLSPLGGGNNLNDDYDDDNNEDHHHRRRQCRNDDEEDIMEVLRITRPLKSCPTINHETPNRIERELLLSDALREFDRLENDNLDMIEFVEDENHRDVDSDIVEDYCWLANGRLTNRHLNVEENNCSFEIRNDYDIDFTLEGADKFAQRLDAKYFDDENASIHSKEYRKENGDVVPDFIDYAHSLDYCYPPLNNDNNNNNKIYKLESPFYNESRIHEWNKLAGVPKSIGRDICQRAKRNADPSVLIKEEIILEDGL